MTLRPNQPVELLAGCPHKLGAHFDGKGTNFAVFSENAEQVFLCLFDQETGAEVHRLKFAEKTGSVWHGYLPDAQPGTLYGYRADGAYAPEEGHRFNVNKLLIDPYTRELSGTFIEDQAILGYEVGSIAGDLSFSTSDSADFMPKSVVSDPAEFAPVAKRLGRGWEDTVIYEMHVKGMTELHPDMPEQLRGTYEGLCTPAILNHLKELGVTAVELLPVHAVRSEGQLTARGLKNYWGYNTVGFFAANPDYFGPNGAHGFRTMVETFHEAGIEVILDVVYNHSAESDQLGPTLNFRGLDNASYYRLLDAQKRYYINDTGCGNTLNLEHPFVIRMVLDSLRFWVEVMGVDGFRFDLATTLGRQREGFDAYGAFYSAVRQDPVLAGTKLIAEPWDIGPGGYQLGQFPADFGEWNDHSRDAIRKFWRGDEHGAQQLASVLLGSAAQFDHGGRRAWSSINFVAAHDGFTTADTTRYAQKHNLANGESNRDGHHANFSDNFGVEGETSDPEIQAHRARRVKNLLTTVLLCQGTPMLLGGDEGGNSQSGNNNAYCQDNETTWIDWSGFDHDLKGFVADLIALRRSLPALRQTRFLHGDKRASDGLPDVEWRGFDGVAPQWHDANLDRIALVLRGSADASDAQADMQEVFLAFNRSDQQLGLVMPDLANGPWTKVFDTAKPAQSELDIEETTFVDPHSVCVFVSKGKTSDAL